MTHTTHDSGYAPSHLQRGLDDYDRDTIAYLSAAGVGDALLERVRRFSGPQSTSGDDEDADDGYRPSLGSTRLVRVRDLRPEMRVHSVRGVDGWCRVASVDYTEGADHTGGTFRVEFEQVDTQERVVRSYVGDQHLSVSNVSNW